MASADASKLRLMNTLTKREEEFTTIEPKKVKMYTCGPTVYGRPHIGNYASFLMADLLRRWLEVSGYEVRQVKNITDVGHLVADRDEGEDKIEKQARAEHADPLDVARKYTEQYLADEKALNMREPFARPRATETIKEMIAIIVELREKGIAYETDDGIYFDVTTFPSYGQLSGNALEDLLAGARVDVNEEKKNSVDFALWKKCVGANAHHLLRWKFPTGERMQGSDEDPSAGFPGWHIECSAMSRKSLGTQIDLHTGGEDNIFPHHESEIAQSESACGCHPFARFWVHRRRIDLGDQKMSKSLGNVLDLSAISEKGFDPLDLRYYLLSVHYRTNLKFTWKGLEDAKKARRKIVEWMAEDRGLRTEDLGQISPDEIREWRKKFTDAMNADLNTSGALAVIFDLMTWSRGVEWSEATLRELVALKSVIRETFGCFEPERSEIPAEVSALVEQRRAARAGKDFTASDTLRDAIRELGYEVKDTGEGQVVRKL